MKRRENTKSGLWSHELHPLLLHTVIGVGGFLSALLLLAGVAVHADVPSTTDDAARLRMDLSLALQRIDAVETRLDALEGKPKTAPEQAGPPKPQACARFREAMPAVSFARLLPSTVACLRAPAIGSPGKTFMSAVGTYQYIDDDGMHELTVQFFDFGNDADAADAFLDTGAYLPNDFNTVHRDAADIPGADAVFTYDGNPIAKTYYTHGALWMLKDTVGILVHGTPDKLVDRTKAIGLGEAIDLNSL